MRNAPMSSGRVALLEFLAVFCLGIVPIILAGIAPSPIREIAFGWLLVFSVGLLIGCFSGAASGRDGRDGIDTD
jgi:hypothetical protein